MGVGSGLYVYDVVVKRSRSLSHLLMSACFPFLIVIMFGVFFIFSNRLLLYYCIYVFIACNVLCYLVL